MRRQTRETISWIAGTILFLALFAGVWFWTQGVWHDKINARLAEWPIHQGVVTRTGKITVSPDYATEQATVSFKDWSGVTRTADVELPDFYSVGKTLPIRVHDGGAAFVPQAYYSSFDDPTKVSSNGFFPATAAGVFGVVDAILCILFGVCLDEGLRKVKAPEVVGRLGTN